MHNTFITIMSNTFANIITESQKNALNRAVENHANVEARAKDVADWYMARKAEAEREARRKEVAKAVSEWVETVRTWLMGPAQVSAQEVDAAASKSDREKYIQSMKNFANFK